MGKSASPTGWITRHMGQQRLGRVADHGLAARWPRNCFGVSPPKRLPVPGGDQDGGNAHGAEQCAAAMRVSSMQVHRLIAMQPVAA